MKCFHLVFVSATNTYAPRPAVPTSVVFLNRHIFIEASLLQSLHSLFFFFSHSTKSLLQQEAWNPIPFPTKLQETEKLSKQGRTEAAGWATSQCCSRAEVSTQLCSACRCLQELPLLQGLWEWCFATLILKINSGVLYLHRSKQKLTLFSTDNLTEERFLFPDFYSILGICICLRSVKLGQIIQFEVWEMYIVPRTANFQKKI